MKKELQNEKPVESGDTCGGVDKPTDGGDYICQGGRWVKIDPPAPDVQEND